jgi:hypothetical protein
LHKSESQKVLHDLLTLIGGPGSLTGTRYYTVVAFL